MSMTLADAALFLFVPADRPERFAKAVASGADAVVVDLEDAVEPARKAAARAGLASLGAADVPVVLRVNAAGTPHHEADLAAAAALPLAAIMVAKAETVAGLEAARRAGHPVVALVETALGLANARALAGVAARLAFGSIDFAADLGCAHTRAVLAPARAELVLASRVGGIAAPVDGVTTDFRDAALVEADARHAADLGFSGKLLIHPAQIAPARAGFAPGVEEVAWARRVLAVEGDGAVAVGGAMIDAPVRARARRILSRAI